MENDLIVDGGFLIAFGHVSYYSTSYFEYSHPINWKNLKEIEIDKSKNYKIKHVSSNMNVSFFLEIID